MYAVLATFVEYKTGGTYVTNGRLQLDTGHGLRKIKTLLIEGKAIGRAISVIDRIEGLSDSEKSDYFGTLASIMKATGRSSESAEMQNHADKLFQAANKQDESEE